MTPAPDHPRESERLALLRRCGILDTASEPDFDGLVDLASAIAQTPIALVSLVDDTRQWFKARHGLEATQTPRDLAFCAHAILDSEPLLVGDSRLDPRFADNPLVTGGPHVVFYAGVPLQVGPDRLPVGTLCVIDHVARTLTPEQIAQLRLLAHQAEMLLDLRLRQRQLEEGLAAVGSSQERIFAIINTMSEGLVVQGRSGEILSCNPAAERILGLTADQMHGRSSLDPRWNAVHADGTPFPGSEHPAMVTLRTGRAVEGEVMGVGFQDGERRWILINSQPVGVGADGLPESVVTTFTDITALRREEEARRQAVSRVDSFFSISLDLLAIAGFDGYFKRLNPAWFTLLGWTEAEMLGKPFLDFIHPDDVERTIKAAANVGAGGTLALFENRYRCRDGSWRTLQWIAAGHVETSVIICSARDVTDDRRRQHELVAAKDAAEAADRAKSAFLATMSHEIRTPMNGVLGIAELLDHTSLDDSQRELLDILRSSGSSLLTIIDDILDWSKIQAGRLEFHPEPVGAAEAVRAVLQSLSATANGKGLELAFDESAFGVQVLADPTRLRQILTNLVGNAIKFTDRGAVRVRLAADAGTVAFRIIDSGIGIPAEHLPRLFSRFSQVDDSNSRRFGGTGLGLAISLQLAKGMGGTLTVDSTPGVGSTFILSLPIAQPVVRQPARIVTAPVSSSARRLNLVLAEDNRVNQIVATTMLRGMGHTVTVVVDGQQAVDAASAGCDAILMDVQMPVMDGLEATRRIRADERASARPRLPILALTASAMLDERTACLDAGMDDVLVKPISWDALDQALGRLPT